MNDSLRTLKLDDQTLLISAECVKCLSFHATAIDPQDLVDWLRGTYIQDAFVTLDAGERDFYFQSGYCDACWDAMFADCRY